LIGWEEANLVAANTVEPESAPPGIVGEIPVDGKLYLINQATPEQEARSSLWPVWKDGSFIVQEDYRVIRTRALSYL
jgi:hypothetical protein